jgi:hypothetical protein
MHANVRRAVVRGYYPGPKWRARVMAMSDEEVERFYLIKEEVDREKLRKAENNEARPKQRQQ